MEKKICSKCKLEKELTEFWKDKYSKDNKRNVCKKCLYKYIHREIRCYFCRGWFTKKYERHKFCNPKCHRKHWSKIYAQRISKLTYGAEYRKVNKQKEVERHSKWYWKNRDAILARRKELRKIKKHDKETKTNRV